MMFPNKGEANVQEEWSYQDRNEKNRHGEREGRHNNRHHQNEDENNNNLPPSVTILPGIRTTDPIGSFLIPPDNATVVNTGWILQAVNSTVQWTNLDGNQATEQSTEQFFSSLPNSGFFLDPRAVYDTATGQFMLTVGTEDTTSGTSQPASVLLGVSNDANPNDGWSQVQLSVHPDRVSDQRDQHRSAEPRC